MLLASAVLVSLPIACTGLTSGEDQPVAVEFVAPPDSVQVGDTIAVHVRALNRSGDSIPGITLTLITLTPDTLGVVTGTLQVTGVAVGPGRIVAQAANLTSDPQTIRVAP